jgi:hypothetical protein
MKVALVNGIERKDGVLVEYHLIKSLFIQDDQINVEFVSYLNKAAYFADKDQVGKSRYAQVAFTGFPIKEKDILDALKALPEFAGAQEDREQKPPKPIESRFP